MHRQKATVQNEEYVFAFAFDDANAAALGMTGEKRCCLRFCGDVVKHVNATDSLAQDKGTQRTNDSFHFRQFRHERSAGSRSQFESECVLSRLCFRSIAKRRENGLAFVPVGKLIGVMAATRLAGLSRGN